MEIAYAVEGKGRPVEGDHLATARGWSGWCDWVDTLPRDDYPQAHALAEEGECYPAPALDALESELARLGRDRPGGPSADVLGVNATLEAALRGRPDGAVAVMVHDGTAG